MGAWKVRLPLYTAGLAAGTAFSVLFTGGAIFYMLGAALVALLVGSAGTYRFILLFPAAALYTLVAVYRVLPLSLSGWKDLSERIGQDIYWAAQTTYAAPAPYEAHSGLLAVILPIVVIVVTLATSATLYEGSPVVSVAVLGLSIGVLSTVSFENGVGPFFALFLVCSVALLLLAGDGTKQIKHLRLGAVLAGALVAGLTLALPLLPFAKEAIRPALVDWTRIGTGGVSHLTVQADVGNYLTEGRNTELLRIKSPEPMLWRGGTLDYFDGVRWSSTVEPGEDDGEEISSDIPTRDAVQEVKVLEAETNLLFGGYKVSKVSVSDAQQRSDGSWATVRPLTEGSSYRILSQIPQPTTAQLENSGTEYPTLVQERFLQLPEDRLGVLRETAQKILTDYDPQTPYATARAIERYLIHDGGFKYNLAADYDRGDRAIEEFLGGNKEGFCTQFATSMALLSRELGIPSRVVYGANSGREVKPNEYVVTGYNIHTWVEIYFPGVGWYPFDATPGSSVPSVMEANAPRPELPVVQRPEVPTEAPAPKQQQPSETASLPKDTPVDQGLVNSGETLSSPSLYALLAVCLLALVVAAVPLTKKTLAARGRPEDFYRDLVGRLRDVVPLSRGGAARVADSPGLTPTERLVLLAGAVGADEEPFREFAHAYSESLYAPHEPSSNPARAYRMALREYGKLPRWKRALGAVNPGSLLTRARRRLPSHSARLRKSLYAKARVLKGPHAGRK